MDIEGKVELGDLNNQSVKEVWESKARRNLYQTNQEGGKAKLPICKNCTTV